MPKKKLVHEGEPLKFLVDCPVLGKVAEATYSWLEVYGYTSYGCGCHGPDEYDVSVDLNCECGNTHTWVLR